jgi:hypothetical protein
MNIKMMTTIFVLIPCILISSIAQSHPDGRGVNFYLIPPGAPGPHGPLDMIEQLNANRLNDSVRLGFNLVRIGVSISSWVGDHSSSDQRRMVALVKDIVELAGSLKVQVIFALFVDGKHTSSSRIICAREGYDEFLRALDAILEVLPDRPNVGIEVLNEPPPCQTGGANPTWFDVQPALYAHVRGLRRQILYLVMGDGWGTIDGLLKLDPRPYLGDELAIFTFHYYEPLLYTHQEIPWLGTGFYRYVTNLRWPAGQNEDVVLAGSLRELEVDSSVDPARKSMIRAQLGRAFFAYREDGSVAHLRRRFERVAQWAEFYKIASDRIFLGEFGVHHPTRDRTVLMWPDAAVWLENVVSEARRKAFRWAVWTLDDGFGILCDNVGKHQRELCEPFRRALE